MNKAKEQPQSRFKSVWSKQEMTSAQPAPVKKSVEKPILEKPVQEPMIPVVTAPKVEAPVKITPTIETPVTAPISDKLFRVSIEYEADTIYSLDDLLTQTRRSNGWNISRSDFFRAFMRACQEKSPDIKECRNYSELVQYFKKVLG